VSVGCWPQRRAMVLQVLAFAEVSTHALLYPTHRLFGLGLFFPPHPLCHTPLEPATGALGPLGEAQGTGPDALSDMARQGKRRRRQGQPTATPPRGPPAASTTTNHLTQPSTPTGTQEGEKGGGRRGQRRSLVPCPASETVSLHTAAFKTSHFTPQQQLALSNAQEIQERDFFSLVVSFDLCSSIFLTSPLFPLLILPSVPPSLPPSPPSQRAQRHTS